MVFKYYGCFPNEMFLVLCGDESVGQELHCVIQSKSQTIKMLFGWILYSENKYSGHQISSSAEGNTSEGPSINPT
jgi:hypothetical protein